MKTTKILMMLFALTMSLALVFGCSDDNNPTEPDGGGNNTGGHVGSVSGIVMRANGSPMSGADVATGTLSTTTNEDGYFVLAAVPEGEALIEFSNDGYMSTFRLADVRTTAATHYPNVVLMAVETGTVDATAGGEVATSDRTGAVDFAANGFVTGAGDPYTGNVNVEINAMGTDDDNFYGTFPGNFEGIRDDGSEVPLVSYGFMTVKMTGENKAPLSLADGTTAQLSLSISPKKAATAPATIPMWYYDETEGVWKEEGEATLTDNTYTADVAHFTTWNWDVPVTDICSITGTVVDDQGDPVSGARVLSQGVDAAIMADTYTASDGTYTVNALKNSVTNVWAVSGSRASDPQMVTVEEVCPVLLVNPLVLRVPAYTISLTWGENPSDLDSHLYIPMTWDDGYDYYQLYYSNEGDLSQDPFAALDTDDTSSYGPEVISGTRLYEGRFQYWVHNYSDDDSAGLKASGASVQLEAAGEVRQYAAADLSLTNADLTGWWHVFDLVVTDGGADVTIERVMEFQAELQTGSIYDKNGGLTKK